MHTHVVIVVLYVIQTITKITLCSSNSVSHKKTYCRLFSRVEPTHKSKIVGYLQDDGDISAMVCTVTVEQV